jgi:hypothetical protein
MRRPLVTYDFATDLFWISLYSILGKFYFLFYQYTYLPSQNTKLISHLLCWFTPFPYEDTVMVHSEDAMEIHSLTLLEHNYDPLAYPLRSHHRLPSEGALNIHSLTLYTKRAQWWITHLTPQKLIHSLRTLTLCGHNDDSFTYSLNAKDDALTDPLTARIEALTYLWITSLLSDWRCEGENSLTLWVHKGELDGPCVFQ